MKKEDLLYITKMLTNLTGVPVRLYKNNESIAFYPVAGLRIDPIILYQDRILSITEHVGYFFTKHFHYYGIVNSGIYKIVIGPTRQLNDNDQELFDLAFRMNISKEQREEFISSMKQIVHIPLSSIIQMLCTFNFVLNNEKTDINDWQIDTSTQEALKAQEDHLISESHFQPEEPPIHNSSEQEELMLNYVRNGDTEGFIQFTKTMAAVRPGVIATTPIRQYKNMFIVTATLVSRAAMQGGLDTEEAFRMSDSYIQECEMMANIDAILNLQYRMILSFTEKVQALHLISAPSPVIKRVIQYIANHISEPISAASIAEKLYLSRPYLSRRFKEETGISISQYIMQQKIQRAAFLLEHTDRSISAISLYLGFSSSAHFSAAFKKNTGMTPRSYRMHKTDKY